MVPFAAYLPHKGEAYLFLEAPKGLPDKEKAGKRGSEHVGTSEPTRMFWGAAVLSPITGDTCIDTHIILSHYY